MTELGLELEVINSNLLQNGSLYAIGPLSCLSVTLVYCGQKAGWIRMPLGRPSTQVGLGPGTLC